MLSLMNGLLIFCAALPLFMANSAFFPFITGKVVFLRFAITTVAILFLVRFIENKSFKAQMHAKMKALRRHPIFLSVAAHFVIFTMSALFAVNKYWAFYGSIERGEGVIGMIFFFGFFLFSALLFEMPEWVWFLKLGMVASVILFIDAAIDASNGADRPASFAGHPIYLGVFFIYVIFSSWIVYFSKEKTNIPRGTLPSQGTLPLWNIFSVALVPMCLWGILIAKARGAMVGLAAGLLVAFIYLAFCSKEIEWRGFRLRAIALGFLFFLFFSGGIFFVTRESPIWQKIPGLNRLAVISSKDATTVSRLLTAKVALRSVDPREKNLDKLLLGWGPENFLIAWNKYYDPDIFHYDTASLDRAHNKLLDVLVMNGVFGLISYLAIWFFAFKQILVKGGATLAGHIAPARGQIAYRSALLFFGVSYFVQNLFVFDSIVTYIPFFAFLSFLIFDQSRAYTEGQ